MCPSRPESPRQEINRDQALAVSRCQNASRCRPPAPVPTRRMRWIEPTESPSEMAPSARTSALTLRLGVAQVRARCNQTRADQRRDGTRGAFARGHELGERRGRQRLDRGDALFRCAALARVALDADEAAAEALATAPVVPVPLEGIEQEVVGPRGGENHRASSASGFCVG